MQPSVTSALLDIIVPHLMANSCAPGGTTAPQGLGLTIEHAPGEHTVTHGDFMKRVNVRLVQQENIVMERALLPLLVSFYYYPAGRGVDYEACPQGTYSNSQGLHEESQCQACPAGKYCDGEGLTTSTGNYCPAGTG